MVTYMQIPQFQLTVTHGGTDYTFVKEDMLSAQVTRRENGWDIATIQINDYESKNYSSKISKGDAVKLEVKDYADASYTTILQGVIRAASPNLAGVNVMTLKCDGAGYGLAEMKCGEEYGSQSTNPTLDTLKEILTDNTTGVVDKWLNCILGSATASGYSYSMTQGVADDLIENIAGTIKYLYFPYKPIDKTLNDICEIVQALKGAAAGPHWIVTTASKLIVSTIGSHHAAAVTAGWDSYYAGSQAASTVEQDIDFTQYAFQELAKEANYILYHGRLKKPGTEIWTENNSGSWAKVETLGTGDSAFTDDNADYVVGNYSLKVACESGAGGGLYFYYPSTQDLNLDLSKIGGEYTIPVLNFFAKADANISLAAGNTPLLELHTGNWNSADYFLYTLGGHLVANTWMQVVAPIGAHAKQFPWSGSDWVASKQGNADWADIDTIVFAIANSGAAAGIMWLDDLYFDGTLLRGAKQAAGYSAADPCKLKVITDDEGKDDSLLASDDSGTMAQLCYAEYLRAKTTPIVGTFLVDMLKDLLPGQLMHVHAQKTSSGTFNIDKDMRVTSLTHSIVMPDGFKTLVEVTDDVTNSHVRPSYKDLNAVLGAVRPEFQDRQATSVKMRDIDITQTILEKSY